PLELVNEIPKQIVELFKARAAALYLPDKQGVFRAGIETLQLDATRLRAAAARDDPEMDRSQGVYLAPVRLGSWVMGSFGICGSVASDRTLEAIGTLIAIAIDRAQAIE